MNEHLIELRVWRQFAVLAEELHFGRAAARLHMTQPPLTQSIAQLESRLGTRLFDRTQRSVRLSAAGAALLPQVRDLLARAQALPAQAQAAAQGEVGRVRLGFVSTAGFELLPGWVRAFRQRYPGVLLELIEATGDVQALAFERGDIDAGLMLHVPGAAPPGFERLSIEVEPLVLAIATRQPLARARVLRWQDALALPLVMFPRRIVPSLHDAVLALYRQAGFVPRVEQEAIQMQTIVNLVSADLGLAWVPRSVTQFKRPGIVYRDWPARAPVAAPLCETSLVWPASAGNPALERFVEFVRSSAPRGAR